MFFFLFKFGENFFSLAIFRAFLRKSSIVYKKKKKNILVEPGWKPLYEYILRVRLATGQGRWRELFLSTELKIQQIILIPPPLKKKKYISI